MTPQREIAPRFIGAWRLLSCETRNASGQTGSPSANRPAGQLLYDAAGNMSAQLMRTDRARFAARIPLLATDAEVRVAFDGYIAYFGTYSVDDVDARRDASSERRVVSELDRNRPRSLLRIRRWRAPATVDAADRDRWRVARVHPAVGANVLS